MAKEERETMPLDSIEVLVKKGEHRWVPLPQMLASRGMKPGEAKVELHKDPGIILIDFEGSETKHFGPGEWRPAKKP